MCHGPTLLDQRMGANQVLNNQRRGSICGRKFVNLMWMLLVRDLLICLSQLSVQGILTWSLSEQAELIAGSAGARN